MEGMLSRRFRRVMHLPKAAMFGELCGWNPATIVFDNTASPYEAYGDVYFGCICVQSVRNQGEHDARQASDLLGGAYLRNGILRQRQYPWLHLGWGGSVNTKNCSKRIRLVRRHGGIRFLHSLGETETRADI
jgi:hypothetical protein